MKTTAIALLLATSGIIANAEPDLPEPMGPAWVEMEAKDLGGGWCGIFKREMQTASDFQETCQIGYGSEASRDETGIVTVIRLPALKNDHYQIVAEDGQIIVRLKSSNEERLRYELGSLPLPDHAFGARAAGKNENRPDLGASDRFMSARLEILRVEEKGDQMSDAEKLKSLNRAHEMFELLRREHPEWKPKLVQDRIVAVRDVIGEIEDGASE